MTNTQGAGRVSRRNFLKMLGIGSIIFFIGGIGNLGGLFNKRSIAQQSTASHTPPPNPSVQPERQQPVSYYIFKDKSDGSYKALNGITGNTEFSDLYDVGMVINYAINAFTELNPKGGGLIRLGTDVMRTRSTIVPKNSVTIEGGGIATVLQLDDNENKDVVKSYDFDNLIKTNPSTGVFGVTFRNLVIDGNHTNNLVAGYGIRKYGYGWFLNGVVIRNCRDDGLFSQWADDSVSPSNNLSMEDHYNNLIISGNQGRGITFRGPHDSTAVQCFVWGNQQDGVVIETLPAQYSGTLNLISSHIYANKPNGNGILLNQGGLEYSDLIVETAYQPGGIGVNCNGGVIKGNLLWCFDNDTGVLIATASPCIMENCFVSKNRVGIYLLSNDHVISGTLLDNNDRTLRMGTGLKIGSPSVKVSGNMLRFKISGSKTQEIDWSNSYNDLNMLEALVYVPSGALCLSGNPNAATNTLIIQNDGPGSLFQATGGLKAGNVYDQTAQSMINTMYDALRKRGIIS